jgi:hypothetical protein
MQFEETPAGETDAPDASAQKSDLVMTEAELENKYRTNVNRKRKRVEIEQKEKDPFETDQFRELDVRSFA